MTNKFDEIIKGKLEQADFAYNKAEWNRLEQSLNASASGAFNGPLLSGIAASILLGIGFASLPPMGASEMPMNLEPVALEETEAAIEIVQPAEETEHLTFEEFAKIDWHAQETDENKEESPTVDIVQEADNHISNNSVEEVEVPVLVVNHPDVEPEKPNAVRLIHGYDVTGNLCVASPLTFVPDMNGSAMIKWSVNGQVSSTDKVWEVSFDAPGTYEVTAEVKSGDAHEELSQTIVIESNPTFDFTQSINNDTRCFRQITGFDADPSDNKYRWTVDGHVYFGERIGLRLASGDHTVELMATSEAGCTNEISRTVRVDDVLEIFFPSSFTPNGDGQNDVWLPVGLDNCEKVDIQIFDVVSNTLVFQSTSARGWDGFINGQRPRKGQTFVYKVSVEDKCNGRQQYSNTITTAW